MQIFWLKYLSRLSPFTKKLPMRTAFVVRLIWVEFHYASPFALDVVASVILHVER